MSVADALRGAILARLGAATEIAYRTESWHSATFSGTRHLFNFDVPTDADVTNFARDIAEDDIALSRGFVADVAVTDCGRGRIDIAALTIDA